MAPPPTSSGPLSQRLLALAQTLQFGWFAGHLVLLLCSVSYGFSWITFKYYTKWAQFNYRTAFIAAGATYGIVVYKAYRARSRAGSRQQGGILSLATDENVQYLAMAIIWLFSKQIPLALLPFMVYSVFHVATYIRSNLLPTLSPPAAASGAPPGASPQSKTPVKQSALADAIGKFVKENYDTSMGLVALLEVGIWFRLFVSALTFRKGSLFLILVYTVFLRARYAQSTFVQNSVAHLGARIDATVANQSTPPAVRQGWGTVKGLIKQLADLTDLRKFAGGAASGAKKPQ
ncbi:MAG: hypothetical protein M1825_005991 [Sarcosagium campestre]|nr:MAG: hypothetical protein M1825_005991 [Sarcosagium campestre]